MGVSDGGYRKAGPAAGGDGRIHLGREPSIRLGALSIEPGLRRVAHDDGREEVLEPRVMQVLVALARSAGAIITRDDLTASCWHGVVVGEDAVTRVMSRLRRLAERLGEGQFRLETITKVGYRLVALTPARETAAVSVEDARQGPGGPAPPDARTLYDPDQIALHGERRYIYAMMTDLDGFRGLSDSLPPEMLANVLNAYLDRLGRAVLDHGGTVDKFVGDAMVAFWGAPIARPDDGERAVRAALALWRVEDSLRASPIGDHPPQGRTRVGLHRGDAVVGAFGSEGRTTYTALGDAMNTAARLESANTALNTTILVSREAIPPSMAGPFRAMGRLGLRGRANPVEVFEAEFDSPPEARERWNAAYRRFDAGEFAALDNMTALAAEFPGDAALHGMLERLETVGPRGVYRLS